MIEVFLSNQNQHDDPKTKSDTQPRRPRFTDQAPMAAAMALDIVLLELRWNCGANMILILFVHVLAWTWAGQVMITRWRR